MFPFPLDYFPQKIKSPVKNEAWQDFAINFLSRRLLFFLPALSEVQKKFFTMIIKYRYEKVLLPVYEKIMKKSENDLDRRKDGAGNVYKQKN